MSVTIETINSATTFLGGVFALLAAIVATLPKKQAAAAIASLPARIVSLIPTFSALAALASLVFFNSLGFALLFVFICAFLKSVQFLRGQGPPSRAEIFMVVIQIASVVAFALMYMVARVLSVLEQIA